MIPQQLSVNEVVVKAAKRAQQAKRQFLQNKKSHDGGKIFVILVTTRQQEISGTMSSRCLLPSLVL